MRRQTSLYIVLGVLAAAAVICVGLLIGMNRDGMLIRHRSEHFVYYCYRADARHIDNYSEALEEVYAAAAESLGITNAGTIAVTIHRSPEEYREAAGLGEGDELALAVLNDDIVHVLRPTQVDIAAQTRAMAYQSVRQMVRMLLGTRETYMLTDALAAYHADGADAGRFLSDASSQAAPLPSVLVQGDPTAYFEEFYQRPNAGYAVLYVAFLGDEEEGTGLLKTLRGGSPIRFARVTGYEESHWEGLWKNWLDAPGEYSSTPQ